MSAGPRPHSSGALAHCSPHSPNERRQQLWVGTRRPASCGAANRNAEARAVASPTIASRTRLQTSPDKKVQSNAGTESFGPSAAAFRALAAVFAVGLGGSVKDAVCVLNQKEESLLKSASEPILPARNSARRPRSAGALGPQPVARQHYNFFANEVPAEACDCTSTQKHQHRMLTKERQFLGRVSMLPTPKNVGQMVFPSCNDLDNEFTSPLAARASEKTRDEICEGLRVLVLHHTAPPLVKNTRKQKKTSPDHRRHPATPEQAMRIFNFFMSRAQPLSNAPKRRLEHDSVSAGWVSPESLSHSASPRETDRDGGSHLPRMPWSILIEWAALEAHMNDDARHKSVALALVRGLKFWKDHQGSSTQPVSGISLVMFVKWTWPLEGNAEIAQILTWMCLHELIKITFPEPSVIEASERQQLIDLFESMDTEKRGFCTAQDVAGGDNADQIKNIVDVHTVRAVCGDKLDLNTFLQFMCQEDYRGFEGSTKVFLKDGRRIIRQCRGIIGYVGWVLEDVPAHELTIRQTIDALEGEIRLLRGEGITKPAQHDKLVG